MQQLLAYGIKLASDDSLDAQSLLKDAEVTFSSSQEIRFLASDSFIQRLVQELKAIQP